MRGNGYRCAFSPCRLFRYELWVDFFPLVESPIEKKRHVMFIGLNPSTADELALDPTLRRCAGFARSWGFDAMVMTNIFAYRSTDPRSLGVVTDPVGPENDAHLSRLARGARMVVAAWGVGGDLEGRGRAVEELIEKTGARLYCIVKTKDGFPAHPLYLKKDLKPKFYGGRP